MSSRASRRNDTTDVIKKIQNDNRRNQGLARQAYSGLASAEYGNNASPVGTAGGSSGVWTGNATTDLNMNTYDVISVDRLSFVEDSGVGTNVNTPQIYISSAASDMVFNNNANDFTWKHSDVTSMTESTTTLKKESTIAPSFVLFNSRTAAVGTAANLYFDAKETTTGNVSMGHIIADTEDAAVNGSGSMHLGVRESGVQTNYIELNEANDTSVRINRSLIMNTSTLFLDTDNDTYIESQSDDQLSLYSGGTNVINIKPTVVLVTQRVDMIDADTGYSEGYGIILDSDEDTKICASADDNIQMSTAGSVKLAISSSLNTSLQPLKMSNNKITDLATPTVDTDASTKKYVDDNAGGGGVTLGNASAWTAKQNFNVGIDLNNADIDDVNTITFNTADIQITGAANGLTYTIPTGDEHYFVVAGGTKLQIGSSNTYSLNTLSPGTSGGSALGSGALPWAGLWCSSITASGPITTDSSLNVGGNVWLGNGAADDIHISGTMDTSIQMGGNDIVMGSGARLDLDATGGSPGSFDGYVEIKVNGVTKYVQIYS